MAAVPVTGPTGVSTLVEGLAVMPVVLGALVSSLLLGTLLGCPMGEDETEIGLESALLHGVIMAASLGACLVGGDSTLGCAIFVEMQPLPAKSMIA